MLTAEAQQLVALPGDVRINAEFPVFGLDDRSAHGDLDTFVAHAAEVGYERRVGVRRCGDAVGVEHVCDERVVVAHIRHQTSFEQAEIDAYVTGATHFPFEVGIGISQGGIGRDAFAVHLRHAVRFVEQHRQVTVYRGLVTRQTVSTAYA